MGNGYSITGKAELLFLTSTPKFIVLYVAVNSRHTLFVRLFVFATLRRRNLSQSSPLSRRTLQPSVQSRSWLNFSGLPSNNADSQGWLVLAEFQSIFPAKYNLTFDDYPPVCLPSRRDETSNRANERRGNQPLRALSCVTFDVFSLKNK